MSVRRARTRGRAGLPRAALGAVALVLVVAGCSSDSDDGSKKPASQGSQSPTPADTWPAPDDPMARAVAAGLTPEPKEHLTFHVHAHLDVFLDGKPIRVPSGIGINTKDPDVRRFPDPDGTTAYGGISLCSKPCISPLHTHDATGIIHTESVATRPNTLGELFTEWGVRLSATCVHTYCSPKPIAFYVNGKRQQGDPRAIALTDLREIAVVIGSPPAEIPKTADFSKA